MIRKRTGIVGLALGLALVLAPATVEAQGGSPRPGMGRQRQQLERQLRQRFQEMVKRQLGLSDETLAGIQTVMQSFQEERMELGRAQASLGHRLQDPALQDLGDEEATGILQEMVELQQREVGLYQREQEQLLTLLSPSQLVRFYALREDIGRRIQELRGGRPGGMGGPGGMSTQGGMTGPGGGFPRGSGGMERPHFPDDVFIPTGDSVPSLFAGAFGERYIVPIFR